MPVDRALPPIPAFPWLEPEPARAETVALRKVYLHVTKACNLRCAYCYFTASKALPDEMSGDELAPLWRELVALGPEKVVFTGGEPLLRSDLFDLLGSLRAADPQHRVLRCLNTNGHLVTPQLAERLVGLADEVRVSVDALAERNDALRGPGSFAAALNALECFHGFGFEPKALVTLTPDTVPDLEDLLCLLFERGITRVNLNGLRPVGRARRNAAWRVDPAEVHAAVLGAWTRCDPQRPPPPAARPPSAGTSCGVGQFLNIMPNGDVFPCHVLTQREFCCGNVREESLLAICRRSGLLGHLQAVDLHDLADRDHRLAPLAEPDTCMGAVYAATRELPVWSQSLPITPVRLTRHESRHREVRGAVRT